MNWNVCILWERWNVAKKGNLEWLRPGENGQKQANPVKVFFVGRSAGDVTGILLRPHILEIDKGRLHINSHKFKTYLIQDRGDLQSYV